MTASESLSKIQFDQYGDHQIGGDEIDERQGIVSRAVGSRHVDFAKQPLQEFHPDDLTITQRYLWKEKHEGARAATGPMPPVDVVKVGDTHYLRDGHHRVDLARDRGQRVQGRVLDAALPWSKAQT